MAEQSRLTVITGGSRGIGNAAAWALARSGDHVVLLGQDSMRVTHAAERMRDAGLQACAVAMDVSDPTCVTELPALIEQAARRPAHVDVLILSAGVMSRRDAKTLRTTAEEWRRVHATNLDGPFHCVAALVPSMVERRSGRVISVSACLGRMSGPGTSGGLAPYRVSKAALNALTRNLAAETGHGSRGVLVDAMCPGHCRTDMGGDQAPRSAEEGAQTIVWLANRAPEVVDESTGAGTPVPTGLLWEDERVIDW